MSNTSTHGSIESQQLHRLTLLCFYSEFSGPITRQRRRTLEKPLTPYDKNASSRGRHVERPVMFEVDMNVAVREMFGCQTSGQAHKVSCVTFLC